MTLFLFPSILTVMTHTLDSPERYQASRLFSSPPSWIFRELLGNGGGGVLGLGPLQKPETWHCKLSFPCCCPQSGQVSGPWPGQSGRQGRGSLC